MAGSIRVGLRRIASAEATFLLLADQPLVGPSLLRRLAGALESSGRSAAACRYAGTIGAPALFRRCWIPRLSRLEGDRGAGRLLAQTEAEVAVIDFPRGALDLDTLEDVARWRRSWLPGVRQRVVDVVEVAALFDSDRHRA
jgi:molybdenum cofactor cytidylyltransferase